MLSVVFDYRRQKSGPQHDCRRTQSKGAALRKVNWKLGFWGLGF